MQGPGEVLAASAPCGSGVLNIASSNGTAAAAAHTNPASNHACWPSWRHMHAMACMHQMARDGHCRVRPVPCWLRHVISDIRVTGLQALSPGTIGTRPSRWSSCHTQGQIVQSTPVPRNNHRIPSNRHINAWLGKKASISAFGHCLEAAAITHNGHVTWCTTTQGRFAAKHRCND